MSQLRAAKRKPVSHTPDHIEFVPTPGSETGHTDLFANGGRDTLYVAMAARKRRRIAVIDVYWNNFLNNRNRRHELLLAASYFPATDTRRCRGLYR